MIDWILAERIAGYVSGDGTGTVDTADLNELAAESERRVTAYTGLKPTRPLPPPEGISRKEWVASNVEAMKKMLDPVLERAGEGLGPLRPAMKLGIGVAVTTEVGVVLGYLAQRVLGQYELVLLDPAENDRPPRLLFVVPNLGQAVDAFGAQEREFMTWVALHEVTHAVQFAGVPWLQSHMAGLVAELLRSAELRIDTPRKLRLPTRAQLSHMANAARHGDMIGLVANQTERDTLDRVQATMAVIEGHAEHVMDVVAPDLLPSLPHLRAALDRRRKSQSALSRIVGRLLGLEMKMRQYEQGKRFCDAVVAAGGPDALHRVFSGPEAMPTLAEIQNPRAWLLRTTPKQLPASGSGAGAG